MVVRCLLKTVCLQTDVEFLQEMVQIKGYILKWRGVNSRLDSLQASILNIKLERIQDCLSSRKKIARRFNVEFSGIGDLILPPIVIEGRESSINYYVIRTKFRDALFNYLARSNIKTQIHYPCALPFQDAYKHFGFIPNDFPIAFKLQSEILSLPFYPFMEEEEIIYLKDNLNKPFFTKLNIKKLNMEYRKYAFAKVGHFGLCHSLLAWARAVVWASENNASIIAPSWLSIRGRIGPVVRGERDWRQYHKLFHFPNYITGISEILSS